MGNKNYDELISKIDAFTRKFYKNQILRGLLYFLALFFISFLVVVLFEYLGNFGRLVRTVLFWLFIGANLFIAGRFILIPTFKIFRLGETISHEQASKIIGKHFPEISDKLLNTLQLRKALNESPQNSLLIASIDQRIIEMRPVPFKSAVNFKDNKRYIKYVAPPLGVLLVLLLAAPSLITGPTDRLIRYNEEIVPIAPYALSLLNQSLEVPENEDFMINIQLSGETLPDKVYLVNNGGQFRLDKLDNTHFSYLLRNLKKDQKIKFYADGFYSEEYLIKVQPSPMIKQFTVSLNYPSYLKMEARNLDNSGDLTVPEGTVVSWEIQTFQSDKLFFSTSDTAISLNKNGDQYAHSIIAKKNMKYILTPGNSVVPAGDSITYNISVIPDAYPTITVFEELDTLSNFHVYFSGAIADDYGFKRLTFNYIKDGDAHGDKTTIDIDFPKGTQSSSFFHHWDLSTMGMNPGDGFTYYFEVWDNDGVNGAKSSRTLSRVYKAPSLDELTEQRDEENESIKDNLKEGIEDSKKLQEELEKLRQELLNKEELDWQDKKKIEELLKRQKELQKQVQELQRQNESKDKKQSELNKQNERIEEKQNQLQELLDNVMNDELKKLMEELERLMEELNKEEIQEQLEKMDFSNEDVEKELDRALEQFKQLEWEMKMEESINKLEKLAEEQEKLAEKSTDPNTDAESLKEEQKKLNDQFEQVKEDIKKLEELNKDLENPNSMPDTEEQEKSIDEEMKKSSEQLDKGKKSKASESQDKAAEEMKEMAKNMEDSMAQNEEQKEEEDMDALRALLENIITLSFDQEELMGELQKTDRNDPKYVEHGQVQRKLKDDAKMVEDSLFALSKRITQLQPIVNKEIGLVNENMKDALSEMEDRKTAQATAHQQYVMTSFNNLALLLDEALKAMQEDMSKKKPGKGNCEKPGGMGSKPSASDLKKMQDSLSKQLEDMKKKMGKDANKGESKSGKSGMSKELAEMAAKQAAIRREVEKMSQELNQDGSGNGNELKKIAKEMEENEKDIVNQQLSRETMKRQEDILTRLLKAENAERQREKDNERKSREGVQKESSTPMKYSEYQKKKKKEIELLKTVPPGLTPYYKNKVNQYFNSLENNE